VYVNHYTTLCSFPLHRVGKYEACHILSPTDVLGPPTMRALCRSEVPTTIKSRVSGSDVTAQPRRLPVQCSDHGNSLPIQCSDGTSVEGFIEICFPRLIVVVGRVQRHQTAHLQSRTTVVARHRVPVQCTEPSVEQIPVQVSE